MKRYLSLLAIATLSACSTAVPSKAPLACVPREGCGCSIVVAQGTCPDREVHFFHDLADGAPLHFNPGGGPVAATASQARTNMFSPEPGTSWTESYRHGNGSIEIQYSPGESSCGKLAYGEQCEYFDVRARIILSTPDGTKRYSGVGACGC